MIDSELYQERPKAKQMYLDPRTKMLLCLVVSFSLLTGRNTGMFFYVQKILIFVPLIFLILANKKWVAIYCAGMYFVALTAPAIISPYLGKLLDLLFTGMFTMMLKIIPGMSMFYFLIFTTTVSEFIAAMDRMRVSKKFTVPASVMFRFFPTIKEEYTTISDAMRMRNVGSIREPIKMLEYRMVPLLTSLTLIGNNLSASALTRGLDAPIHRTNICPIGFHWQDFLAMLFCFIVIVLLLLSVFCGY